MSEKFKDENDGNTLLHLAAKSGDASFAKELIAAGCDVDAKNDSGEPSLALAIQENKINIVKVLLHAGANCKNDFYKYKQGPLHMAALNGHPEIVQLLIEMGFDVNTWDEFQRTPLHCVCATKGESDDKLKIIKNLVAAGSYINAIDANKQTPLIKTFNNGFFERFKLLMSMGAKLEVDHFIINSSATCDFRIFQHLIELGYDVNMMDSKGNNCLYIAALHGNAKMMEFLLKNGAVMRINDNGTDPLFRIIQDWSKYHYIQYSYRTSDSSIKKGYIKCFNILIEEGANVNYIAHDNLTSLYIVLKDFYRLFNNGLYPVLRSIMLLLLKNGAKFDFEHPVVRRLINDSDKLKFSHLLLRHTAMYEAQNRNDGPVNFNRNTLNEESRRDYASCRDELELMKIMKVDDETNVTFFNVLVNPDIGPYTCNESIRNVFETSTISKNFPIYQDLLGERFSEESEYQSLVQEATNGLSHLLKWDKSSLHVPLHNIIRYLNRRDLIKLTLIK